jgi:hypothetical protein
MATSRIRWRWVLPICQVLLAIALLYTGTLDEKIDRSRMEEQAAAVLPEPDSISFEPIGSWGYVPLSTQIAFAINFPATLALIPLKFLDLKLKLVNAAISLVVVFVFWWWVGRCVDVRSWPGFEWHPARITAGATGLLLSSLVGTTALLSYWGHTPVAHIGAVLWSLFGAVFFLRMLRRAVRAKISRQNH